MGGKTNVLYWFRTDLRLHDSPALAKALDLKPTHLYPIWCWDPHYVHCQNVAPNRWRFLLESMSDVSSSITALNPKSQLFVIRGPPTTVLPALFKSWSITHLVFERDDDPYTIERDTTVQKLAKEAGVEVITGLGRTLYEPLEIQKKANGKNVHMIRPFSKLVETMPGPPEPIEAPKSLPDPGPTDLKGWKRSDHSIEPYKHPDVDVNARHRDGEDTCYETFVGPDGKFSVPTLTELGMEGKANGPHRGGETRGLEILDEYMKDKQWVLNFKKPETNPAGFDPRSTTVLSPHMKFGTVSIRLFRKRLLEIYKGQNHSDPPESLLGQLYFREMFHFNQAVTPNFHQIKGNPMAMHLDWRLPNIYKNDGSVERIERKREEKRWEEMDPEAFEWLQKWRHGETGFPWIDACMRQLKTEGWIHHLARHTVACFLTRGHLYISWERGQEVFDDWLIDWDPSVNSANWMWLSCTAYFAQYFRVYSPVTYGKKWDKKGEFIRHFVPELKDYPDKYIYSPWEAPQEVQKKAKCVIGTDYPFPIIDDKKAKSRTLDKMQENYKRKIHGDHADVVSGKLNKYPWWEEDGKGAPKKRKAEEVEEVSKDGKKQKKLDFGAKK